MNEAAINHDLIRQYASGATEECITNLLTLFDAITDQRNRAEFQVRVLQHELKKLGESLLNITKPLSRENYPKPEPKPNVKSELPKQSIEAMELEF